jgi:hypothetical protein
MVIVVLRPIAAVAFLLGPGARHSTATHDQST